MNWKTVSTLITMVVVAGCQENVTSPEPQRASAPAAMSLAPQGHPSFDRNVGAAADGSVDFTVGPNGGLFFVGQHSIYFPAHSVCDPALSSYGPSHWDESCTPLRGAIRIHAETRSLDGRTWVDFSPSLRFVPSDNPARWVWLTMTLPGATASGDLTRYNILYAPAIGGPSYDESLTDPTLRTYVGSGVGVRRVKHFSGYNSWGEACTPTDPDPLCTGGK